MRTNSTEGATEPGTVEPAGHESGFADFYAAHYLRTVRLARLLVDSVAIAEEIAQDAFVELMRGWHRVDQPTAYLRVATVNRCRSWGRRRVLERRHQSQQPQPVEHESHIVVRDALRHLRPRQRAAIVLRYYEDLSEADIARVLGCRPGTVKSLVSRGLATMREYFDAE